MPRPVRPLRPARPAAIESLEGRRLLSDVVPKTGTRATYFAEPNFTGATATTVGVRPNVDWGDNAPVGADDAFAVRWTARLVAPSSEAFRFYAATDGGVRVWVGHALLVDDWATTNRSRVVKGSINLKAGRGADLMVEYRHAAGGDARLDLRWQTDTRAKQPIPFGSLAPRGYGLDMQIDHALAFARGQIDQTLRDLKPGAFPQRVGKDGRWETATTADWTSGFFGGALWHMDDLVGGYAARATAWSTPLAASATASGDHFGRVWQTFKPLHDRTGKAEHRRVLLNAAASKNAQWNARVGAFETPNLPSNGTDPRANLAVLMDQTMDLELMLGAADQTNDQTYRDRVRQHLRRVHRHMVRGDGGVVQRAFFDRSTGRLVSKENYQGLNNASTWSRGQAWAVYGFARLAKLTGDANFLAAAQKVANYYLTHLPADGIPNWDFAVTAPNAPRDTSAAAIAANGLFELATLAPVAADRARYRAAAETTLGRLLAADTLVEGQRSSLTRGNRGILAFGSANVPKHVGVDTPLIFGDCYLLEAIATYRGA